MDLEIIELAKIEAWMDEIEADFVSRAEALLLSLSAELEPMVSQARRNGSNLPDTFEMPGRKRFHSLFWDFLFSSMVQGVQDGRKDTAALRKKRKELARRGMGWLEPVSNPADYLPTEALTWIDNWTQHFGQDYYDGLTGAVVEALKTGLLQGNSIPDIVGSLSGILQGPEFSSRRLEVIARTNLTTAYNQGRLQSYWEDSDFIKAVRYSAVLDKRVTLICRQRHGKIIPLSDIKTLQENTPPMHYNCRSLLAPVDDIEFAEIARQKDFQESMSFAGVVPPSPGFGEFRVNYKGMPQPPDAVPVVTPPPAAAPVPAVPVVTREQEQIAALKALVANTAYQFPAAHCIAVGKAVFEIVEEKFPSQLEDIDALATEIREIYKKKRAELDKKYGMGELTEADYNAQRMELLLAKQSPQDLLRERREEYRKYFWDIMGRVRDFGSKEPLNMTYSKRIKDRALLIQDAAKYFPSDWWSVSNETPLKLKAESSRAYCAAGQIGLTKYDGIDTAAHEMGHMMEDQVPSVKNAVRSFFNSRTDGGTKPMGSLHSINSSYRTTEFYYEDTGFYDPYMAKHYSSGDTEVLSMTMGNLVKSNKGLIKQKLNDPETLEFIAGLLLTQ